MVSKSLLEIDDMAGKLIQITQTLTALIDAPIQLEEKETEEEGGKRESGKGRGIHGQRNGLFCLVVGSSRKED